MPNTTNKIRFIIMGNTRTVPPQNDIDPMKVVTQVTTSPYQGCIKTTRNGNEVKVDIIVEVTTCPNGVGWVGGGTNDNNAKSALTKVEVKV